MNKIQKKKTLFLHAYWLSLHFRVLFVSLSICLSVFLFGLLYGARCSLLAPACQPASQPVRTGGRSLAAVRSPALFFQLTLPLRFVCAHTLPLPACAVRTFNFLYATAQSQPQSQPFVSLYSIFCCYHAYTCSLYASWHCYTSARMCLLSTSCSLSWNPRPQS